MTHGIADITNSETEHQDSSQNPVTDLAAVYHRTRSFSEELCSTLEPEDCVVQTMPEVSPTKWHVAHTSWFFETFIIKRAHPDYTPINQEYAYLFNSYYNAVGQMHSRTKRGFISRPTLRETFRYRARIDQLMDSLLTDPSFVERFGPLITLGINHEQQHQELMLTDIKHVFSENPLRPSFRSFLGRRSTEVSPMRWISFDAGIHSIGNPGDGFFFDNEGPRHRQFLEQFQLASRLVTNGEYLAFVEDGGYQRPELWLSLGWATINQQKWEVPLYWEKDEDGWWVFTLGGMRRLDANEPVCHLSYFEAEAFARWADSRLPTEFEWEVAAGKGQFGSGNFSDQRIFHPVALGSMESGSGHSVMNGADADRDEHLDQMFGDVWEWTRSSYAPYPGYAPVPGAIGEYNGKFMCNQYVLRGGSCVTTQAHIRPTYRNFFPPPARWQFTGLRLARDI
jgi:ergothioneine biosynthesis protein EgtB